jgi:cyclic pyranopterin monophosphate synthase
MDKFSHLDDSGQVSMVDISAKTRTERCAWAEGRIKMAAATAAAISSADLPKGNVLTCAKIAGIQAAKRTSELIPLCHPLALSWLELEFEVEAEAVYIRATAKVAEATGVEMEALTAVSVAALTIYDMCKAVDKEMVIEGVTLVKKTGGKSDYLKNAGAQ